LSYAARALLGKEWITINSGTSLLSLLYITRN
jgi:hypothetical protein